MADFGVDEKALWKEAAGTEDLRETLPRIFGILARAWPLTALAVQAFDVEDGVVETILASAADRPASSSRMQLPRPVINDAIIWAARGEVRRDVAGRDVTALSSAGLRGIVTLAGLVIGQETPGRAVFALGSDAVDRDLSAVVESLSLALRNELRFRQLSAVHRAAEADRETLLARLGRSQLAAPVIGEGSGLANVMTRVRQVTASDVPVLLFGETGSGKEVVARAIHERSSRAGNAFVRVNCGAIPPELIDSELFGHERGSFTGATETRKGWFERADRGTLFLDEIAELPLAAQVRLLRILQDGTYQRVGGQRQLTADVRVIAATHRNLQSMVVEGTFREDLWYRIAVFPISIPPLRDRPEDIPALARYFAERACRRFGLPPLALSPESVSMLVRYPWPGNVRELSAVIDRAAILGDGRFLHVSEALGSPATIPAADGAVTAPHAHFQTLDEAMRSHIESALRTAEGRVEGPGGAARLLGIHPSTLRARMRALTIDWRAYRRRS